MATNQRGTSASVYRSDIDGLRAIAVCAVVLFHAFPRLFPGGFIGVDIFFVISGFLITGVIRSDIDAGTFRISGFYLRRIRRIFPALLLVLGCCLITGWFLLTNSSEFMRLGKHTAAAAGFAANFFYWAESGYFDSAARSKPLLHLWSLGVEEQFYLIWPLVIAVSQRKSKSRESALAILVISFAACVLTTVPQSSSAFYSPATRIWELALGGVLALSAGSMTWGSQEATGLNKRVGYSWLAELSSAGGFILIGSALWALDGTTLYPSWRALLPTLGAALIIGAGRSAFLNRWLLSHPVMVFVGLISYPLYLWHWPLLSFAHINRLGVVPPTLTIWLLAASVILAVGTYLLIERPLRRTILTWRLGGSMVAIMACLGISGGAVYANRGAIAGIHTLPALANSGPLKLPDVGHSPTSDQPPSSPARDGALRQKSVEGEQQNVARAGTTGSPLNDSLVVGPVAPSLLMRYRARVSRASASGNPDAYFSELMQSRYKAVRAGSCDADDPDVESWNGLKNGSACEGPVEGAKNIIVIGDSIAADTYAWIHMAYPEYNVIQKTGPGCNLIVPVKDERKACNGVMKSAFDLALSPTEKIDAVVLASLWNMLTPQDIGRTQADPLIDKLLAVNRKVVLVGPPVGFTATARDLIDKCPGSSADGWTPAVLESCAREHSTVFRPANKALKEYAQGKGIEYIDLHELTCNDSECPLLDEEGQLLFVDAWHRSFTGDAFVARRVRDEHLFERILDLR